jgi:hypothetical protein
MPRVAPGQRKRAYGPKTRTGCLTCKCVANPNIAHSPRWNTSFSRSWCLYHGSLTLWQKWDSAGPHQTIGTKLICWLVRRVKCDEATPSCYSCTSTGRKCDGYEPIMQAPPHPLHPFSGALSQSPPIGFLGTEKECQSFYFFRQKTAPQMSAFFGSNFWERLLLQAALHEPSIRHAILALGSIHATSDQDNGLVMQGQPNGWTYDFALKNYSQAINILVKPFSRGGQQAIDVCLICSILFACLEVSRSYI